MFATGIYMITMSLVTPSAFYVVRHVLYAVFHRGPHYVSLRDCPLWEHLLFTLPLFGIMLLAAEFITDLGVVMSVSGSLAASNLAFILPCLCYLKLCPYTLSDLIYGGRGGGMRMDSSRVRHRGGGSSSQRIKKRKKYSRGGKKKMHSRSNHRWRAFVRLVPPILIVILGVVIALGCTFVTLMQSF